MTSAAKPNDGTHVWQFQSRFRKSALGWRGSSAAIERLNAAVAEIRRAARTNPTLAAEGAVKLIGRISPAFDRIDTSSGALGSAVRRTIEVLVPIVASAPVEIAKRRNWLDLLWKAYQEDEMAYIESVGELWGELCSSIELSTEWAERLLPVVRDSFRARNGEGRYVGYFKGTEACLSAFFAAGRFDEILNLVEATNSQWWGYRCWGFRSLVALGRRAEALRYAEAARTSTGNEHGEISRACEELLLQSGLADEAYRRYGVAVANSEPTYVGRFRALAAKYPLKEKAQLLRDLIASTPGYEGKWFAAAKTAGLFEEAIAVAQASPCDPKTLGRAARDFLDKRPDFALDAVLAALRWCVAGYGYDITIGEVAQIYRYGLSSAEKTGRSDDFQKRLAELDGPSRAFVAKAVRFV